MTSPACSPLCSRFHYICFMKESKMNIEFNRNEDAMKMLLGDMQKKLDKIYEGGGKKAIEKQREKNKLTLRERIDYLVDKNTSFNEIGAFAGYEMYAETV